MKQWQRPFDMLLLAGAASVFTGCVLFMMTGSRPPAPSILTLMLAMVLLASGCAWRLLSRNDDEKPGEEESGHPVNEQCENTPKAD